MVEFSKIVKRMRREASSTERPARPPSRRPPSAAAALPKTSEPEEEVLREPIPAAKPIFTQHRPDPAVSSSGIPPQGVPAPAASAVEETPAVSVAHSLSEEEASALYDRLMDLGRKIFVKEADFEAIDTKRFTKLVAEAAAAIADGDERLIELSIARIIKGEKNYLLQHAVNTCLISLAIGAGNDYETQKLIELGLAAFLHDVGMVAYEDLANVPRPLTEKEYAKIKNHVAVGDKMLRRLNMGLSETILSAQYEIHERLDGSGYPTGRRLIHEYAKIVALAESFESMLHPRPFRPRYSVMEVYKRILEAKSKFDPQMIKILVDRIGFFPNGSFVVLNTREVGRVIGQNRKSPLRPVIRLLFDEAGGRYYEEEIKDINLVKFPTLHIVKCYLEDTTAR